MPTYDYKCTECGAEVEYFHGISAPPMTKCETCGGKLERLLSAGTGLIFKGSGFYITDYKGGKPGEGKSSGGGDSKAGGEGGGGEGKSSGESKGGDSKGSGESKSGGESASASSGGGESKPSSPAPASAPAASKPSGE